MNPTENKISNVLFKEAKQNLIALSVFVILSYLAPSLAQGADRKNIVEKNILLSPKLEVEKPVADGKKILLRGKVDMFTYAYKEAGITLASNVLPSTIKSVVVGSSAFYANLKASDKLISAYFKDDKLCLSINRNGTPYYTEIRLSSQPKQAETQNSSAQMLAVGFRYYIGTGEVTYIDRNSDLFGKVNPGDKYMYLTGINGAPINSNNGNSDTSIVYPVFRQRGALRCYPCRQKPIDSFVPDMAERFRREGFGISR